MNILFCIFNLFSLLSVIPSVHFSVIFFFFTVSILSHFTTTPCLGLSSFSLIICLIPSFYAIFVYCSSCLVQHSWLCSDTLCTLKILIQNVHCVAFSYFTSHFIMSIQNFLSTFEFYFEFVLL